MCQQIQIKTVIPYFELFIMLLNLPKFLEILCRGHGISNVKLTEQIDTWDVRIVRNLAAPLAYASNDSSNILPVSLIIRFNRWVETFEEASQIFVEWRRRFLKTIVQHIIVSSDVDSNISSRLQSFLWSSQRTCCYLQVSSLSEQVVPTLPRAL
jgi:hypothetical protein